jgi:hypothetical protein
MVVLPDRAVDVSICRWLARLIYHLLREDRSVGE